MSHNRRGSGGSGGGRFGGGRFGGSAGNVNPWLWQWNSGPVGPTSGHPPQGQMAMASNQSMIGGGYGRGPNGPRMGGPHTGMRQQGSPGAYNKDNRRRGDGGNVDTIKFSGPRKSGGVKEADKCKSTGKVKDESKNRQNKRREQTKEEMKADKMATYDGVPSAVLYCHVCSKHMWDPKSFEKHIRGKPHEIMVTYLDEVYRIQVDIMRHHIKAVEFQKDIDLERVRIKSNSGNQNAGNHPNASSKLFLRSYCAMCDVSFCGPLTGHRKSDRHRKLKLFLHPECKLCGVFFHTRLEFDEHKLTAGHLMIKAKLRRAECPELKDDEFDLLDMIKIEEEKRDDDDQMPIEKKYEMLKDRDFNKWISESEGASGYGKEKKDTLAIETDVVAVTTDAKVDGGNNMVVTDQYEMETSNVEAQCSIVRSNKDENVENEDNFPIGYDPNVVLGKELLVPSEGYVCRLCNCFLLDQQLVENHFQTAAHYVNYTSMTKKKEAMAKGKKRSIAEVIGEDLDNNTDGLEDVSSVAPIVKLEPRQADTEIIVEPHLKRAKLECLDGKKINISMDVDVNKSIEVGSFLEIPIKKDKSDCVESPAPADVKSQVPPEVQSPETDRVESQEPDQVEWVVPAVITPIRGRNKARCSRGRIARRAGR